MRKFFLKTAISIFVAPATIAGALPVDLGSATGYTILSAGLANTTSTAAGNAGFGSAAQVVGSVGGRVFMNIAPNVRITGDLDGGFVSAAPSLIVDGTQSTLSNSSWEQIHADLVTASTNASSQVGTSIGDVTSSQTLSATGPGVSVYRITGTFNLSSGASLTLSGGASSQFIINVENDMTLGSGAAILLSGGVRAENVLFNLEDSTGPGFTGPIATIGAASILSGVFIGPYRDWHLGSGTIMDETRILMSGFVGQFESISPPAVIPEPSTLSLVFLGLVGMASSRRVFPTAG